MEAEISRILDDVGKVGEAETFSDKRSAFERFDIFEDLDVWLRRKLRNLLWRQWKKPATRFRNLKSCGISDDLARQTAHGGHGPWFASGTKAMNFAFPKKYFDDLGLVSLLDMRQSR